MFGQATELDEVNLQRIIRVLTSQVGPGLQPTGRGLPRLTNLGQTLVTDDWDLSLGAYGLQHHLHTLTQAWAHLHEAVLDLSAPAFKKAHGLQPTGTSARNAESHERSVQAVLDDIAQVL
ncbi:hypothetical protein EJ110_NYTH03558 [Nymphaea thermarum]|nr:hypothetical protein EJ110_NYTH03558 [Nymphaea thermarum]